MGTRRRKFAVIIMTIALIAATAPVAAHEDDITDDQTDASQLNGLSREALSERGAHHLSSNAGFVSNGPSGKATKNLSVVGRGERNDLSATTDVWALGGYAYTGTFNTPCGGDTAAGIYVWERQGKNVNAAGIILSEAGDRTNDVKVAAMNSGDVLVMSNESCSGGDGGFEIYNVDDPRNPTKTASVTIDELNPLSNAAFGGITEVGVHNLFLFTRGGNDYVAVVAETAFDNFMIFDITDPANPTLVSAWGAEELNDPGVGDEVADFGRVLNSALWLTNGFGASANKFLHDVTISADGNTAYLANWDAGLVMLDISDVTNPTVVSVAIDPANGSLDGEVNSHAVWPSEDGSIVLEGEEDFSAWEGSIAPTNLVFDFDNPIPGVGAATTTGDAFEDSQTGSSGSVSATELSITAGPLSPMTYAVAEIGNNATPLGATSVAGDIVFIGQACNGDALLNVGSIAGSIAIVRRGACTFSEKSINAAAAGATAVVIANNQSSTPWSGLRIWDYSDSANPVLASTFDTTCSASTAPTEACDENGTYSAHNVIVESSDDKVLAYVSWYNDGILVLDISDPYNPVEVARYLDMNEDGVTNDFWGIYKEAGEGSIYASDRHGGLYILKLKGKGSGK